VTGTVVVDAVGTVVEVSVVDVVGTVVEVASSVVVVDGVKVEVVEVVIDGKVRGWVGGIDPPGLAPSPSDGKHFLFHTTSGVQLKVVSEPR
jgi:hypothetical protein